MTIRKPREGTDALDDLVHDAMAYRRLARSYAERLFRGQI